MITYRREINPRIIFRYLGILGGFIFKAKNLHWAASDKSIHEYLDDFWKILYDFQDTIAEGWMGIAGQLKAGDVSFVPAESEHPMEFIREVEEKTIDFYDLLPEDPQFKGLCSEIETFIQEVEKYKYLFSLCFNKDGEPRKKLFSDDSAGNAAAIGAAGLGTASVGGLAIGHMKKKKILKNAKAKAEDVAKETVALENQAKEGFKKAAASERRATAAEIKKLKAPVIEEHLDRTLFDKVGRRRKFDKAMREYNRDVNAIQGLSEKRIQNAQLEMARNVKGLRAAGEKKSKAIMEEAAKKAGKLSKRAKVLGGAGLIASGALAAGNAMTKGRQSNG